MPKATIQDVLDMGFSPEHFGNPSSFAVDNADGYIYKVLQDIALEIAAVVTDAVYADANATGTTAQKQNFTYLKKAEMNLCAATLMSRRIIFLENSTHRSVEKIDALLGELRRNAQRYDEKGWEYVTLITGATQNGTFSTGFNESGIYPLTS